MVCTRHHGSHVGGQEQKHLPPLGTELHFHVNSSRKKNSFVLTEHSWPPCHMVANQNKYFNFFGMLQNAVLPIFFGISSMKVSLLCSQEVVTGLI